MAEERGLPALSMRAVAERLSVTPMTLYGYFPDKDALLDALVDHLLTRSPLPSSEGDWADRLRQVGSFAREIARQYPATFPLLFSRPVVSAQGLRLVEVLYQALLDAGVAPADVPRVERMFGTFVLGFATSEVSGRFAEGTRNARTRRSQLPPEDLPAHHALASELDREVDWDAEFQDDLEDLLAAIAAAAGR